MLKHFGLGLVVLLVLSMGSAMAQAPIIGKWKTIDDETNEPKSIVEIFEKQGQYYGKVVKLFRKASENPHPLCDKCDASDPRKGQPIEGMEIIQNMKADGDIYAKGTILDPKKGKTYKCKLWVEDNKLRVQGSFLFISRTQTWFPAE